MYSRCGRERERVIVSGLVKFHLERNIIYNVTDCKTENAKRFIYCLIHILKRKKKFPTAALKRKVCLNESHFM